MPTRATDIEAAARRLLAHRDRRMPNPVSANGFAVTDMRVAYAIQDAADRILRHEKGYIAAGYKIAGTNPAARAHLKIDAPFHGRLYDRMISASPARLDFVPDFHRVYEPEIALEIDCDLYAGAAPFDASRIAAATRAVLPAIEIIGTHFTPWEQAGAANLAADNAAFGHWIVGAPVSDWSRMELMDGPVTLVIDGEIRASGRGRNVDGGAFGAAAWLANALAAEGRAFKSGDFITTGSVTAPVPVAAGQHVLAEFGDLGRVEVSL